jgi:hypothetical protein
MIYGKETKKSLHKAYLKWKNITGSRCFSPLNYKPPTTHTNKEKDRIYIV